MTEATAAVSVEATTTLPPGEHEAARSLTSDAWRHLKRNPIFWVSDGLIVVFVLMAIWPSLFPRPHTPNADMQRPRETPAADACFVRDIHGFDSYARSRYRSRAYILVGVFSSLFTVVIGGAIG